MSLRQQLQAIYDTDGQLTPDAVVEAARPRTHPLHDRFEWDNRIAGPLWRRQQAHELIASVKITYKVGDMEHRDIRAFHAVRRPDMIVPSYEPVEKIADDPILKAIVLADMERDILALKRRYDHFEEFTDLIGRLLTP